MFSKACEYGIRAVLYLAIKGTEGQRLGLHAIATEIDSPQPFTAKILQMLSRDGIIASAKGPGGGFYLEDKMLNAPLLNIVKAIDGDYALQTCTLGLKECSDKFPCPIHDEVKAYKNKLRDILSQKTIRDLSKDLEKGQAFLKAKRVKR